MHEDEQIKNSCLQYFFLNLLFSPKDHFIGGLGVYHEGPSLLGNRFSLCYILAPSQNMCSSCTSRSQALLSLTKYTWKRTIYGYDIKIYIIRLIFKSREGWLYVYSHAIYTFSFTNNIAIVSESRIAKVKPTLIRHNGWDQGGS